MNHGKELTHHLEVGRRINLWYAFEDLHLNVYIRLTSRMIEGVVTQTLDLASVEVEEEFQGKGFFTQFLDGIEALAKTHNRVIYVESILNSFLPEVLRRRGYVQIGSTINMIKRV